MELTLEIKEENAPFFLELIRKFDFVNIKKQSTEGGYNPEFVAKIRKSEEQFKAGKYKIIETENLWD